MDKAELSDISYLTSLQKITGVDWRKFSQSEILINEQVIRETNERRGNGSIQISRTG